MIRQKLKVISCVIFSCFLTLFVTIYTSSATSISETTLNNLYDNGAYYYNPDGNCSTNTSGITITGGSAAEKVWNGLISLGFTKEQAAAIMGNMDAESKFNPFAVYKGNELSAMSWDELLAVTNHATGLTQWLGDRRKGMLNSLAENTRQYFLNPSLYSREFYSEADYQRVLSAVGEANYDSVVASQLEYTKKEIDVVPRYQKFLTASSVEQGAQIYCVWNETPASSISAAETVCGNSNRAAMARAYYDKYSNSTPTPSGSSSSTNDGSNVLIIGDSITERSKSEITALLPKAKIDSAVGRTFQQGFDILKAETNPRDIIVFALGSNDGTVSEDLAEKVIAAAGNRKVVFVTDYSLGKKNYDQINLLFNSLKTKHNNVFIADWATAVSSNPTKYIASEDVDVHPTVGEGTKLFAKVIADVVNGTNLRNTSTNPCTSSGTPYVGGIPQYFQCDERWGNLWFGSGGMNGGRGSQICPSGCGPTSFAMMATALLGREILPSETADVAGKAGMYVSGAGSSWAITKTLADHYGLQFKDFSGSCSVEAISNALRDGWMIHTSGKGSKPFTPGGHYIGITGMNEKGEWYIANSARRDNANGYYDPNVVLSSGIACGNLKGVKK